MSTDRLTEIINYLTTTSRDVGEFRAEVNARFGRVERERRLQEQRPDRIEGMLLTMRADVSELQDRVGALENMCA